MLLVFMNVGKVRWVLFICITIVGIPTACDEDGEIISRAPQISNLIYYPHEVAIKLYEDRATLSGTIDFKDEDGDLASLRITTSTGTNVTADIEGAEGQKQGTVNGILEFYTPTSPTVITFDIWAIDKKGNVSNKLSGTIDVIIDDSANQWLGTGTKVSDDLNDVCWGSNQFIIVGNNGTILTSPNGRDWTMRNSGVATSLHSITWSGTHYVVVGQAGTILLSTEGIAWTPQAIGYTNDDLSSVAWSGAPDCFRKQCHRKQSRDLYLCRWCNLDYQFF